MSEVKLREKEKFREVFVERGRIGQLYVESVEGGFLVFDGGNVWFKPLSIIDEIGKVEYKPPAETPYPQYKLEAYSSDFLKFQNTVPPVNVNQLVYEVYNVFNDFLDVEREYKELLTVATFLSYQQEKLKTVPYIYFTGEKGTGKSRALELAEWLMYRPLNATSITGANVFHYLADGPKVILDDEVAHSINNDADKRSIYLVGYRCTGKVPRITEDSKGKRKQKFYNAYSFKMFASKEAIKNDQLLDRCVTIKMVRGNPRFGGFSDSDEELFHKIRTRLLIWRLHTINDFLPYERPSNRIDELFNPLLAIAKLIGLDKENIIAIRDSETNERLTELKSSLEYKVALATVVTIVKEQSYSVKFNDIFNNLRHLINGVEIKEGKITSPEFGDITKQKVGRICKDILGGKKHLIMVDGSLCLCYSWTKERFVENCKQYQIYREDVDELIANIV
jgi:hypothetical protein